MGSFNLTIQHSKTLGTAKDSTAFDINSPEWNAGHNLTVTNIDADSLGGHASNYYLTTQSVQTQGSVLINNSSGAISFIAGSNISLSQSASNITINGASGGAGLPSAGISGGNTSNTSGTYTGSLLFAGGNNITLSAVTNSNGQTITISGANAGGAQTGISGIAGSNASTATSGTVQFANSNGLTFGLSGNTITGSHNGLTAQSAQTGISGIAGSGASTVTNGTVQFANSNNISFGLSGSTITGSVHAQQTGISAIYASDSTYSSGTVQFSGSNNVTVSYNASTIIISGANTHAQQTGISGIAPTGNTTGTTANLTSGSIALQGGNNITISQSSGANSTIFVISGPNSHAQQTGVSAIYASDSTYSSGTVQFSGSNNVTVSYNASTIIISGPTTHAQQSGISGISADGAFTTGTVRFTGSGNVSVYSSAANQTIIISGSQSVQSAVANLNGSSASLTLSASNGITISNTSGTILFSVPTVPTSYMQQLDGSSGSLTLVAGNLVSVSNNANTISIINLLSSSATAVAVGSSSSAGSLASRFALADHSHQGIGVAGISGGNTSNTSGTYYGSVMFAGSNNITLSAATGAGGQTITVSGPTFWALSAPSASANAGTIQFSNSNNMSWTMNGSTIVASASFATTTLQSYNGGIAALGGTVTSGTAMFSNSNNVTFGMNGSTVTASASGYARNWGSSGASTSWVSSAGTATNQAKLLGAVTITPVNNGNSVYLDAIVVMQLTTSGGHTFNWWRSNGGGQTVVGFPMFYNYSHTANNALTIPLRLMQVDSPAVSSAITYNLYHNGGNSKTVQVSGLMLIAEEL
jgi:hypothetical protein